MAELAILLSEKRREHNQEFYAFSAGRSGKPRAGASARTGRETVTTVNFSDDLRKLADRSDQSKRAATGYRMGRSELL